MIPQIVFLTHHTTFSIRRSVFLKIYDIGITENIGHCPDDIIIFCLLGHSYQEETGIGSNRTDALDNTGIIAGKSICILSEVFLADIFLDITTGMRFGIVGIIDAKGHNIRLFGIKFGINVVISVIRFIPEMGYPSPCCLSPLGIIVTFSSCMCTYTLSP